jgi:hypothetical protein
MIRRHALHALVGLSALACGHLATASGSETAASPRLPATLTSAMARYAALASYADTGTIRKEAPGLVDESRFTTRFRRASRDLYFEFQALKSTTTATGHVIDMKIYRVVIWMAAGRMQKYDFYSKAYEPVAAEGGGQVRALQGAAHMTSGASILVPSLIYSQARLPSTLLQIEQASEAGVEAVGGRRCHKIVGVAAARYPSGRRTGERPVTVWIDVDSGLIRRVFEDTPTDYQPGAYSRLTVTLDPHANPAMDDAQFQFTMPPR